MSNGPRYSPEQLKKLGYVEKDGVMVQVKNLVNYGKVEKIEPSVTTFQQSEIDRVSNRKVLNATKVEAYGIKFDSQLEKHMYDLLTRAQIEFQFQKEYLLQEKFRYNGEGVRAITLTVDFLLPDRNMVIDTKGYANDVAPLKYKMLKWHLYQVNKGENLPHVELPSTKEECNVLLNRILYEFSNQTHHR